MNTEQLRIKVLDLAIHGKLVPQDASEEPAIVLLKKINLNIQPITRDTPFNIPKNWCWVQLGNIISLLSGRDLETDKYNDIGKGVPYIIGASNFNHGKLLINRWIEKPLCISKLGDLLITCKGTVGEMAFNNIGEMHIARQIMAISSSINLSYIKYFLNFNLSSLKAKANGLIPGISRSTLLTTLIPIPPLAEQCRIVEKVESIYTPIDTIEQSIDNIRENIKATRQKLLSMAIRGELVPQDPNDEPAIELLKRINPKFTPLQYDEPLPQGWSVCKMSMICSLEDGDKITGKKMINLDAKYLRGQNEGTVISSGKYIRANSLIILVDGENSGEVFRAPIDGYQGSTFKKLIIDSNINEKYVLQVINSHRLKLRTNKVGIAIPHLNKKLFAEIMVHIPPLDEQQRIVEKLELLFNQLDNLEKST